MVEKFSILKPHINIVTIGHIDAGKTTLAAAILKALSKLGWAKPKDYEMIDKAQGSRSSGSKQQGKTINASHEEFESEKFHCSLIDCPGHEDYIKNMITGTAQADGAILVVSSAAGVQIQTEAHMILAKQIGVEHIVVFVNDKSEEGLDEDTKALVEMDVREKLVKYGYEKDGEETTPIIFASARKASEGDPEEEKKILHLIKTIDNHFPIPERDENKPFLMWIEAKYSIPGIGTVVTGRVERGKLETGKEVEIVGLGQKKKARVKGLQSFRKFKDVVVSGDDAGIALSGINFEEVERGQVLAAPGTVSSHTKIIAQAYIFKPEERGRKTVFGNGFRPQFFFNTADVTGTIKLEPADKLVNPGEAVEIEIDLGEKGVVVEEGDRFIIWEGNVNVGKGAVTKIIE